MVNLSKKFAIVLWKRRQGRQRNNNESENWQKKNWQAGCMVVVDICKAAQYKVKENRWKNKGSFNKQKSYSGCAASG